KDQGEDLQLRIRPVELLILATSAILNSPPHKGGLFTFNLLPIFLTH
ncbi:MAG: hypothetical protein RLY16_1574, partial [Bacteroidota bacterium]